MVTMPLSCKLENAVRAKILGRSLWIFACELLPVIPIYVPKMSEIYRTVLELGLDNIGGNLNVKILPSFVPMSRMTWCTWWIVAWRHSWVVVWRQDKITHDVMLLMDGRVIVWCQVDWRVNWRQHFKALYPGTVIQHLWLEPLVRGKALVSHIIRSWHTNVPCTIVKSHIVLIPVQCSGQSFGGRPYLLYTTLEL